MKIKEKKRQIIQVACALICNCNFPGFLNGQIYQGRAKSVCVPGLNCYSCPGAVASCPVGSLQTALVSARYKIPCYILGLILLFGVLLGRVICGFFCPFGFLQELLYKIPTKKIRKGRWSRKLSILKYGICFVFVILIPLWFASPGFCKYICPVGTLEAGIPLTSANQALRSLTGVLFSWKVLILVLILVSSVFIFRSFCRFLCPLGAFYSLFHNKACFRIQVDEKKCTGCRACISVCKMDVTKAGDRECIQCGECRKVCQEKAIMWKTPLDQRGRGKYGVEKSTRE